jgi:hypothetical protein
MPSAALIEPDRAAYLRCPIPHGNRERSIMCIRRRFSLLMSHREDLIVLLRETGIQPDGEAVLSGPPLLRRRDVFDARDWFVDDAEHELVWYVRERPGIAYPPNVTYPGGTGTGWSLPRELVGEALATLVEVARHLKAECAALHIPWREAASAGR